MVFASQSFSFYFFNKLLGWCRNHSQRIFFRYSEHSWSAYWFQLVTLHKQNRHVSLSVHVLVNPSLPSQPLHRDWHRAHSLSRNWNFLEFPLEAVKLRYHHKQLGFSQVISLITSHSLGTRVQCDIHVLTFQRPAKQTWLELIISQHCWVPQRGSRACFTGMRELCLTASITTSAAHLQLPSFLKNRIFNQMTHFWLLRKISVYPRN